MSIQIEAGITLKHSDERLIEVLANINPHLAPYTAALGKEAAARILILESNLRLEQIERCKCLIRWKFGEPVNGVERRMNNKWRSLGDRSLLEAIQAGDGHEAIYCLENL